MYTTNDDLSSQRNGVTPIVIPDGDFLDLTMREPTGFGSTGFPDDEPAPAAVANLLAAVTDALLGEIEDRMSISEAKAFLEESAPGIPLRIEESACGWCGIPFGEFAEEPSRTCRIKRVVSLGDPAPRQEWCASDWRSAINACLSDLNPSQAA